MEPLIVSFYVLVCIAWAAVGVNLIAKPAISEKYRWLIIGAVAGGVGETASVVALYITGKLLTGAFQ